MDFGCLILAAGESKRMGTQKLLLPLRGKPILQHVVDLALSLGAKETVAVIGSNAEDIRSKIDFGPVKVAVNPNYKLGLSTSLRVGIESFESEVDAYLVMLGDQPLVRRNTILTLLGQHWKHGPLMTIPLYGGIRGNPVVLSSQLVPEIEYLEGDSGAKQLTQKHSGKVMWVEVDDPGVLVDVDTPHDYQKLVGDAANQ
jgi:molybdenum cofactor cytidylyltransferase